MLGTRNLFRLVTPMVYFGRQIYNFESKDKKEIEKFNYMKFDKDTLRELTVLEYKIEKRIEDDLIKSGFKIKRRIEIPKHLEQIIGGELKID